MKLKRLIAPSLVVLLCATSGATNGHAQQYVTTPADDEESLSAPPPETSPEDMPEKLPENLPAATPSAATDTKATLPYTPYPAGLSWVMTRQAFRVPIPDRIYYPTHTYVRRCPYYPRGYYWGANWRFNVIGRGNLLLFGSFRYNPYLTAAKAQHRPKLRGQQRYAPPPGPIGQAMLLGSAGQSAPLALPPTTATGAGAKVATVRLAPQRRPALATSSRRAPSRLNKAAE